MYLKRLVVTFIFSSISSFALKLNTETHVKAIQEYHKSRKSMLLTWRYQQPVTHLSVTRILDIPAEYKETI
jgi:hypothetical protein